MFSRRRFPDEVVGLAVRWDVRFRLSDTDVVEVLAERGVRGAGDQEHGLPVRAAPAA